jgi:hypothetical protein
VKQGVFVTVLLVGSLGMGYVIYKFMLPDFMREGGPLVSVLIALSIMLAAYIVERMITLRKARGSASIQAFFRKVVQLVQSGDLEGALAACDKQRGSLANVLRAGVERYQQIAGDPHYNGEKRLAETQRAIEEANALEVPLLERNLIALSTIASIATMVGHRSRPGRRDRRERPGHRYFRGFGEHGRRAAQRHRGHRGLQFLREQGRRIQLHHRRSHLRSVAAHQVQRGRQLTLRSDRNADRRKARKPCH